MTATAAKYTWFEDDFPELAEAYCITLVRDVPPADVLHRLGGRPEQSVKGIQNLVHAAFALREAERDRHLVAMARVGGWTLLVEPNGYLGISEETALPVSAGTTWVSHYGNQGLELFLWAEDTTTRLFFEPGAPDVRQGTTPDALLEPMHHIGFQFWEEVSDTDEILSGPAAFALTEYVTGVQITPSILDETTFVCGSTAFQSRATPWSSSSECPYS